MQESTTKKAVSVLTPSKLGRKKGRKRTARPKKLMISFSEELFEELKKTADENELDVASFCRMTLKKLIK